jgi:dipeptidyl aminopeptidase/acylaminoacyl peptidase
MCASLAILSDASASILKRLIAVSLFAGLLCAQSPEGALEAHWIAADADTFWFSENHQFWKYDPVAKLKTRLEAEPVPDHPVGRLIKSAEIVGPPPARELISPDGKWFVGGAGGNLYLRATVSDRTEPLTADGSAEKSWEYSWDALPLWSPDSRFLAVRHTDRHNSQASKYPLMHWLKEPPEVEWVPLSRTGLISDYYIIDIASHKSVRLDIADSGNVRGRAWRPASSELLLTRSSAQQIEVLAANPFTGSTRLLFTEKTSTFLDVALTLPVSASLTPLPDNRSFLWLSERDGWNQIYRYDYSGALIRKLTTAHNPVERIVTVAKGGAYFTARGGLRRPYDIHLWRVGLNGGTAEQITTEPGQHDIPPYDAYLGARGAGIQFSPSGRFFLDTHSDINTPTQTDLRSADGQLIEVLSKAYPPNVGSAEEFTFKAADDVTDLYGVIYKPDDFDPTRKYPILDFIYAGPQMTRVPRLFGTDTRERALANLGLITVVLDARGTPGRGKAFQDVVYRNMGRYEIADHVAVLRQLADAHSWIDLKRAAVLGGSFGGYFAVRAMLQAADVFQVGVAMAPGDIGDNVRRWMDAPENNRDGYTFASNLPLVPNLRGSLLLIHGTSDLNAKFATTMRLIDALVKAGRPYDLIVVPEADHRVQGSPYVFDAVRRYLIEHLGLNKRIGKDGLAYVRIPFGTLLFGCSPGDRECFNWEQAPRQVSIPRGFWLGQTEVTQEAWQRIMGANPSRYQAPNRPVDQVSWSDARGYCPESRHAPAHRRRMGVCGTCWEFQRPLR